eukprot:contig_12097_g2892
MQNDDVLRGYFGGKVYEAQRANMVKILGIGALMLALALCSDGTVVTTSGDFQKCSAPNAAAACAQVLQRTLKLAFGDLMRVSHFGIAVIMMD